MKHQSPVIDPHSSRLAALLNDFIFRKIDYIAYIFRNSVQNVDVIAKSQWLSSNGSYTSRRLSFVSVSIGLKNGTLLPSICSIMYVSCHMPCYRLTSNTYAYSCNSRHAIRVRHQRTSEDGIRSIRGWDIFVDGIYVPWSSRSRLLSSKIMCVAYTRSSQVREAK